MQSVWSFLRRQAAVAGLLLALTAAPAGALDLFARHQVMVQFATQDGKPMANAEVRVFAPGQPSRPALTGRTDSDGKFDFPADRDGFWSAEARSGDETDPFGNLRQSRKQRERLERGCGVTSL